mgnify:CR=1 FL=1
MFQAGDTVFVKDGASEDIGALACKYVHDHREASVVRVFHSGTNVSLPESEALYIVKWRDTFEGGWDWRFDTDWRERHAAWVERYKEREGEIVAQVQGAPLRLDLTELPWERQRALVSRWQALWEKEALNGA